MRFYSFAITTMVLALAFGLNNTAPTGKKVDTSASKVVWKGYKVTGSHEGTINIKEGTLEYDDNGMLTGGSFTMDMTSIDCTDLDGGMKGKLVGHLKSDDFFGVEKHPTASFKITKAVPRGLPGEYKIVGDLSIKGKTNEVKFDAKFDDNGVGTAKIEVDRSEYDVRYGSASFFNNLKDKTIYDEFELEVSLVTK